MFDLSFAPSGLGVARCVTHGSRRGLHSLRRSAAQSPPASPNGIAESRVLPEDISETRCISILGLERGLHSCTAPRLKVDFVRPRPGCP
jgi:hypothetical protein